MAFRCHRGMVWLLTLEAKAVSTLSKRDAILLYGLVKGF
jgi:hypothetical protein